MSTKWDKYIVEEETSPNKWDKYAVDDVKKKDITFEDFQTSMQDVSKAPEESVSEVPSTLSEPKEEEPTTESKILTDVDKWYEDRGGMTPQQKMSAFNRIATQTKSQYEQNIQANPDKSDELLQQYQTEVDNLSNQYGIVKEDGKYTVSPQDLDLYKERVEESYKSYLKDLSKTTKNDPFMSKLGKRLSAGSDRFLNIPVNVMAISETVTNAVAEKLGAGESTYWQDRAAYMSNEAAKKSAGAQVGEGEIVAAMQAGDVGEAAGNLVLDIAEQVPQLLSLWAGNAAGVTNASLGLIGAQVGTDKFVQNKELGMSDWLNAMNSITSAGIEITTEAIGTVPLFKNMNKAIKMKGVDVAEKEIAKALQTPFERAYANVVGGLTPMVRESASEVAAELSTQIVDKYTINPDIEIGEGLADIAVSSAVIGKVLSSPTEYMSKKTREQVQEAYSEVPEEYTAANKLEATELILKIDELKEASKGKNKILAAKSKEKISVLEEQLLDVADRQDKAAEIDEQISELDKEIIFAEEQEKSTEKLEKQQEELIIQREEVLQAQPIEEKLIEKPTEASEEIRKDEATETIPEEKEELKRSEIKEEVKPVKEEVKDAVQEQKEVDVKKEAVQEEIITKKEKVLDKKAQFKQDFLSDDVNLENIDVPLKMKDKIAAAKNLREGKMTKQAEILEDYLNQSFEAGQLELITPDKKTRTAAPISEVIIKEEVIEPVKEKPVITKPVPKAEEVKIPKVEPLEPKEARTKVRGTEENIFQAKESEQQQFVQTIVDANKETYEVLTYEAATENAKKYIRDKGTLEQAYNDLLDKSTVEEIPTRQVARLSLMDYYSRKAINPKVSEQQQDDAISKLVNLEKAVAREATSAGQASAVLNIWKAKQPESVLKIERKKIEDYNKRKLQQKVSGNTTIEQQIGKVEETINKESKRIANEIIIKSPTYKKARTKLVTKPRKSPKKRQVNKEKIKKEQDYRKERLEKWRKEKGTTLQAGAGFTSEDIEFAGDMVASYVREGYYRLTDITQKLTDDFRSIGIELTDDQIKQILAQDKDGEKLESTLRKQEAKSAIPETAKELGTRIDEVIKKHWSEQDDLGRDLIGKLIDEAGLTTLEAQELSNIVLNEYQKQIKDKSQSELTKLLGRSPLPRAKQKRKDIIDKLTEATNLGALDTDFYTELFSEYFGLQQLTSEQSKEILRLADNLQKLKGTGLFETEAAKEMANYMYELYPKNKGTEAINLWMDMAYASLLSGASTSVLNMVSAGSNIAAKPVRDLVNLSRWVDVVRKHKTEDKKAVYNPFGEMVYAPAFSGMKFGAKEARKVYVKGGIGNKYIEQIANDKGFKVSELERGKFGEGKRFKPVNIKVGDKKFDINIFNAYKYSGRNLLAQDRFMYSTIHDVEMASLIADKYAKKGLSGKKLRKAVIDEVTGRNIDQEVLSNQLENDIALYEELTGKKVTKVDRDVRTREIMLDMLDVTPEERQEIEQLARANIFTDDRGGLIAHIAYGIGTLANTNPVTQAVIKPFVPFTKIVGNVTEYMLDHVPVYGQLRAHGLSPTSIYKKITNADISTAQMGDKGSRAYYEQMGRAWLGTVAFSIAMAIGLGSDEDDFIQITGGRSKEGWKKAGRQEVTPNYTLRIGDVELPYLNIPSLAIPLGLIGNVNDALQLGMQEGDLKDRLTVSLLLSGGYDTITMTKDMSIVQGISALTKLLTDVLTADENRWSKIGNETAKRYLGFASKPLPQNVNLIKQIEKFFDPTSYSRKDIKEILSYTMGVEHFFDLNNPSIDQLGDVVETYPGETLLPYTHWLGLKGGDSRWKFLAKYNAIPTKIFNTQKAVETKEGFEKRRMTSDEFYEYTKLVGEKFSDAVLEYMSTANLSDRNKEKITDRRKDQEVTGVQYDINKLRSEAKNDAFTELFRWGVAKKEMPKSYNEAKKYDALKPYQTSKVISVPDGDRLKKYTLDKGELYRFNTLATLKYLELLDKQPKVKKDIWKDTYYTDKYGVKLNVLDEVTDDLWTASKKIIAADRNKYINQERYKDWKRAD